MASDSDNDAGTSIASDPGTHGPPCRIAAVATAQQRKLPPRRPPLHPGNVNAVSFRSPSNLGSLWCSWEQDSWPGERNRGAEGSGAYWKARPRVQEACHRPVPRGVWLHESASLKDGLVRDKNPSILHEISSF